MSAQTSQYADLEKDQQLNEPEQLVPIFLEYFSPNTVCDVGCGLGNFLAVFKNHGKKVMGFDGPWVNAERRRKYLEQDEFQTVNFELGFPAVTGKFDLAICLEVAEHLSAQRSDELIAFLTALSPNIIFSAAIPFQSGDNHINEKWESYWEEKFNKKGFKKYDLIRHRIWTNKSIQWWYRQNIVVYSNNDLSRLPSVSFENAVTRECYEQKTHMLSNFSGVVMPKPNVRRFTVSAIMKLFGERTYRFLRRYCY